MSENLAAKIVEKIVNVFDGDHRVEVRSSNRHVRVLVGDVVVAETRRPLVLSETGYPDRFYVPVDDVRPELVEPSETHTFCPFKGTADYVSITTPETRVADAAWTYPTPRAEVGAIAGHLSFSAPGVIVLVDGLPVLVDGRPVA
jgi:uncharacterized protein (DUF427 family)